MNAYAEHWFCIVTDFHVTCGAQRAANNRVEVRCAKLDESGPPITAISYSMNGGSPIRGK